MRHLKPCFYLALTLFLLLPPPLRAQSVEDTRSVQWAVGGTIGHMLTRYSPEPEASGSRKSFNLQFGFQVEARFSEHWSALFLINLEEFSTWRDPTAEAPGFTGDDPEFITHPYTSSVPGLGFGIGGQYNYRIGGGDLSLAATLNPTILGYQRKYDLVNLEAEGARIPGIALDEARNTFQLTSSLRLQYTYWFDREFAIGAGLQLRNWTYLSGAMDTPAGRRFRLRSAESSSMEIFYDNNYDVTSQTIDPTRPVDLSLSIHLTRRL